MTQTEINGKPVADYGPDHPLTGAPIVHSYSRAQALEDGFLVDVTDSAQALRFRYPVAVTDGVWKRCITAGLDMEKQPEAGGNLFDRIGQLLGYLRAAIKLSPGGIDRVEFTTRGEAHDGTPEAVNVYALCGAGDDHAPCITIMLQGED